MLRDVSDLAGLRGRARRLLAVFPHPDDEAYGPAGTLARTAAEPDGAAVLLCLTRGEASAMGPARGLPPAEVAALRERRLEEVGALLGLQGLVVPGLPDGRLARLGLRELAAPIAQVLDAYRPQVVIGHDPRGVNAHPDHIATHWALRHALLDRPGIRFAMLAYLEEAAVAARPRLLFPTPEDEVDAVLHLTPDEVRRKEAALRVHEALVTLSDDPASGLIRRPPIERYDFLGERCDPPVSGLFAGLSP